MFKLFGFAVGVAVTLGGIYWLLGSPEPPEEFASGLAIRSRTVQPIPQPIPDGLETSEADSAPSEPAQTDQDGDTTGADEAISWPRDDAAQAAEESQALAGPRGGGDQRPAGTVWHPIPALPEPELPGPISETESAEPPSVQPLGVASTAQLPEDVAPRRESAPLPSEVASAPDTLRFVFWSPFRTERAAQGFADRLRLATAIPVAVVRLDEDRYRVAFDYRDEAERLALVERIEQITGLELSGDGLR